MSTQQRPLDIVLDKLPEHKSYGDGYRAKCPVHNGKSDNSLSIKEEKGTVLLKCFSGCEFSEIVAALELHPRDLFPHDHNKDNIQNVYDYFGEDGHLLYQVVRFAPKTFRPRRPNGGDWEYKIRGTRLVLYRLPELVASDKNAWVFLTEGEKSANAIARLGLVATTSQGGANAWNRGSGEYANQLKDRKVCILPDNDLAGRKYANDVARSISGFASDIRILHLPGLTDKQDPFDWVASGGSAETLLKLVEQTEEIDIPEPEPTTVAEWRLRTLADAYKERDPLVYIAEDLFSLPSLSIVYGAPGCLKSMLLTDLGLCVGAGIDWLPGLPGKKNAARARKTISVPVLWIDYDNGQRRTDERAEALGRSRNLEPTQTSFYYASMPTPWLDGGDIISMAGLIELANAHSIGFIIIDNLGTVSGDADENSAAMVKVLGNFRNLAEKTGAAVVLIHHQRKSTGFNTRAGETLRGHSSIEAALDIALLVEREEGSETIAIKSTKTRGTDVLPFGAQFAYDHKPGTKELEVAQFYGVPVPDNRKPARAQKAIIEVLENIECEPNKTTLIRKAQGIASDIGVNYFRDTITNLVQSGAIKETETGENNARVYKLA